MIKTINKTQTKLLNDVLFTTNLDNSAVATRTGKTQFSFQSQRKAMPKNAQTTAQLHSSHMLVK